MLRLMLLLALLAGTPVALGEETPAAARDVNREAMELVNEFMERLKQDAPFTYEEGERYFPDNLSFTHGILMYVSGYTDKRGQALGPKPRFSPLCEWIRINRKKFLPEFPEYPHLFAARTYSKDRNGILTPSHYEVYMPFGIGVSWFANDVTRHTPMLTFFYSEEKKCLLMPFMVDGAPVDVLLGLDLDRFDFDGEDESAFNDIIRQLKAHLEELEKNFPAPDVF